MRLFALAFSLFAGLAAAQEPISIPPPPTITAGFNAPAQGRCNSVSVGTLYVRSANSAVAPLGVFRCTQVAAAAYLWEPIDHLVMATLPAKCSVGDIGYQTAGTPGLYVCTSVNTWVAQGGGGTIAATTSALRGDGSGNAVAVTGTGTDCVLVNGTSGACGSGSGTVTTTGSPVSGNMAKFSGATSITNAAYTDVVTLWASGSCVGYLKNDGTCSNPSGSGTVTVVGSGSLTSTALVTGGGGTTVQTAAATATMDSSGNISTPGTVTTGVGSGNAGASFYNQGTLPTFGAGAGQVPATGYVGWAGAASGVTTSYGLIPPVATPSSSIMICPSPTSSMSQCTWTAGPAAGNIAGTTNPLFDVDSSLGTSTGSGFYIPGTSLTAGSLYFQGASGLALANASTASSAAVGGLCIAISTTQCMPYGIYRFSASQSWTVGGAVFVGTSGGALTQTAPSTSGYSVQRVGYALANDTLMMMVGDVGVVQ